MKLIQKIAVLKKVGQSPTAETMGELHDVDREEIEAMVGGLKGQREIVIFNRHRIPLPPVAYP